MNGETHGRRNIIIILVFLALFDVAAIVLLTLFPHTLPGFAETFGTSDEPINGEEQSKATDDSMASDAAEPEPADSESEPAAETPEPSTNGETSGMADGAADAEEDSEAMPENLSQIDPIPASSRRVASEHTVMRTNTFYDLTGRVWDDAHFWPDLYLLNSESFPDPDLISEGSTITIYRKLGSGDELNQRELATLMDAYVRTYATYRELGEESLQRGRESGSNRHIQRGRIRINKAHWLLYSGLRFDRGYIQDFSDRIQDRDERVVQQFIDRFGYPER